MSLSVETLAVARKYTDDSLAGAGAVAGVPCKIQSITAITGGNRVTFLWTDNNGDDHTSAMDVMNGVDGEDGKGIQSVSVNAQNHLIITYTDGTTVDAGQIEIHSAVDSVNGQTGAVVLDAEDVGALPDNTPIPSKTSDLTNDSGFATTSDVSTALADYTKTADLTTLLAAKQDTLTFDNAPTENSNNPVKSGGVYSAEADIFAVMGQNGAKNLIPYDIDAMKAVNVGGTWSGNEYTYNGITFAVNSDGTITVSGIASALTRLAVTIAQFENGKAYTLTGCPEGGNHVDAYTLYTQTVQNYDDGEGVTFNWSSSITSIAIAIFSGIDLTTPITFKPMLRLASDTDDTYVPYAKTNQQLTDDAEALTNQTNGIVNVLGAKNVLPFPYYAGSGTYNGVTITDNGDGSITLDGTCTGMSFFVFYGGRYSLAPTTFVKKNEDYIATLEVVSGSMAINSGTSRFVFRNYITNATSPFVDIFYEENVIDTRSVKFTYEPTASYDTSLVWYEFNVGTTFNNWRIRPMIRLASIQDDTYEPYAKTNQQLTEDTTGLLDNLEVNGVVNILPIDLNFIKANNSASSWSGNACTHNGVTYTIDEANGKITVNGTASARSTLQLYNAIAGDLFKKSFKYLAKVFNNNFNTVNGYYVQLYMTNSPYTRIDAFTGNNFVVPDNFFDNSIRVSIQIVVEDGKSVDNQVITPLIAFGNYTGGFEKYAKSNRELTEELTVASGEITRLVSFSTLTSYRAIKYGKVVELYFAGTLSEAVNIWTDFLTVPDGFRPSHYVQIASFNTYSSCKNLQLAPSGGIQSASNLSSGDYIRFSATYIID